MSVFPHLSNGKTVNDRLAKKESRVSYLMKSGISDQGLIETAYLWCLARWPGSGELADLEKVFRETPRSQRREMVEDLFWALMTSREFLFQH